LKQGLPFSGEALLFYVRIVF